MTIRHAILATLIYHNIFDYPLTEQETYNYLIKKSSNSVFKRNLEALIVQKKLSQKNGYIYLNGRGATVKSRRQKQKSSDQKLKKAHFYARILRSIPTVSLVAISGALAMENSDKNDDIDLVVISSKNTIWTTRLLVNIILSPYRRRPGQPHTKDKACLNLFLDETSLRIGTQNLYIAHEIAQMRPVWQRQNTYSKFIKANSWIKNYLPNWQTPPADSYKSYLQSKYLSLITYSTKSFAYHLSLAEKLAKVFQLTYMRRRVTSEKIGDHQLFFHPGNTQQWVLDEYQKRIKKALDRLQEKH